MSTELSNFVDTQVSNLSYHLMLLQNHYHSVRKKRQEIAISCKSHIKNINANLLRLVTVLYLDIFMFIAHVSGRLTANSFQSFAGKHSLV